MRRIIISTERCMACSLLGLNPTKGEMFLNSKEDDGRSNSNTKCKCLEETHNMLVRSDWNILKNEERLFHAPEAKSHPTPDSQCVQKHGMRLWKLKLADYSLGQGTMRETTRIKEEGWAGIWPRSADCLDMEDLLHWTQTSAFLLISKTLYRWLSLNLKELALNSG